MKANYLGPLYTVVQLKGKIVCFIHVSRGQKTLPNYFNNYIKLRYSTITYLFNYTCNI